MEGILQGKRALVTGAASGIGLAVATKFAQAGAAVALVDLDGEKTKSLAREIASPGTATEGFGCDVSNAQSVDAMLQQVRASAVGAPNVVVNCAGIAHVGSLGTTTPEDLDRLYAVNVRGTYLVMRAALDSLLESGGVILNMASIAATSGLQDRFAYSMTKGAVLSMTLSVAKDYIHKGIRCNCISPARVHTPFVDGFVAKNYPGREAEKMAELSRSQPIGRMGTPEEIAKFALYLCSDDASFLTGADYLIDGGFTNVR